MKRLLLIASIVPFLLGARIQEPAKAPANGSYRAEFLAGLDDVGTKLIQLAEAVPAQKYSWRPAPGVRSISEVFTHVAGSNYFLLTFLGKPAPAGLPEDMEKITDKAKVVSELKRSIDHLRATAKAMNEAELEKAVKMFGTNTTRRGVYGTILNHMHEHLGQSIAYARINGIAPPWSRGMN
jgi:uncharacterized damage-inducible protein DinB